MRTKRPPPGSLSEGPASANGAAAEVESVLDHIVHCNYRLTMVESLAWGPGRHVRPHAHADVFHLDLFHGLGELTLGRQACDCPIGRSF